MAGQRPCRGVEGRTSHVTVLISGCARGREGGGGAHADNCTPPFLPDLGEGTRRKEPGKANNRWDV